jgi:chaperone required for assembly of F1-ATPase
LAEAIAGEWRAQGKQIQPGTMFLTRLANTAIDRVAAQPQRVIRQLITLAASDLLCYRAERPAELAAREAEAWDPLLQWACRRYGANLLITSGTTFVQQSADALENLELAITAADEFALAGLHAAATLLRSTILALALLGRRLTSDEAIAAAELDAHYQMEKWGSDPETLARVRNKTSELDAISKYFVFLGL